MAKFLGWRMVALCWLAQNCAIGLSCGSYGAALTTLQDDLGVSRAEVSYGLGLMLLVLGLVSPLVGGWLNRVKARSLMMIGAVMNVAGYLLLTQIDALWQLLVVFTLLIGPGACMLGMIPASTIVSRWFDKDRGKALAVTNMPAFMLIIPPISAWLVAKGGVDYLYFAIAVAFALLIPVLLLLIERPEDIGQSVRRHAGPDTGAAPASPAAPLSSRDIWTDPRFWLLSLGIGILTGCGSVYTTHIIPIVTDRGVSLTEASLPMSTFGAGTLVGALVFGWLIDRFGAISMLILNAVVQTALWALLLGANDLFSLAAAGGAIGACMGSLVALHSATLNEVLGPQNFSRAMGYSYLLKVPFLFGLTPLAGHLYDIGGTYDSALLGVCGMIAFSIALFLGLWLLRASGRIGTVAAAE